MLGVSALAVRLPAQQHTTPPAVHHRTFERTVGAATCQKVDKGQQPQVLMLLQQLLLLLWLATALH